jgi:alginate O-acetyltransferase complex protein AlgI
LIKGYSLEGALQLAPITPASVVLYPGAQQGLLTTRELKEWLEKAPAFIAHIYALVIIIPGWVIFYFTDTEMLIAYVKKLFSFSSGPAGNMEVMNTLSTHLFWLVLALILCMPVYHTIKNWIDKKSGRISFYNTTVIGFNVLLLFICVAQLVGKSYNPFIYFRF